ncbi:hypothetical protein [Aestuariivirga sp.]|uniref:hypothetical protein n=1 Tax=Aestuariivirga sp. TaxID=2650926 RepID=UPI00301A253E
MPNNILYARGFFLTIGKRWGKRQNRSCTDKNAKAPQKANEMRLFRARQSTDEPCFQALPQRLASVKMVGGGAEVIVDNFSGT